MTIVKLNKKGEKSWLKFDSDKPIKTEKVAYIGAHILFRPQDVTWKSKNSHFEEIDPIIGKQVTPAAVTGSVCVPKGTSRFLKEQDAQVLPFPVDPVNECNFTGNLDQGDNIVGSVDTPTYIGYAATKGKITLLNQGSTTLNTLWD